MAFPVTLNGRTYTLTDFEGTNYVDGLPDAFEDFVTQAGQIYSTTSTTSNSIGTGSKTFTVEASKPYQVGTPLRIADTAAVSTNWIDGIVTAYSGTTLTVNAVAYAGSGTKTAWSINIGGGPIAYTGTLPIAQGGTGATTAAAAQTNLDVYSKADADSRFLNVSGEASAVTISGNLSVDGGTIKLDGNYPTGTQNVALGDAALDDGSLSGGFNTAIGRASLSDNTSGSYNSALGNGSLQGNEAGDANTAVGYYALTSNTASYNVAVGHQALEDNTSGNYLTAVGQAALANNTSGIRNSALGRATLGANTTGNYNSAVGYGALDANETHSNNTAMGYLALTAATANNNTAVGFESAKLTTTGHSNSAAGYRSLHKNLTGNYNSAFGYEALYESSSASNNTAVGYQAGYNNTTSSSNTFFGSFAGYNTTSGENTFIGEDAGYHVTSGAKNTIIGGYNGNQDGLDIRTSSNNIVLSDGDGEPVFYANSDHDVWLTADSELTAGATLPAAGSGSGYPRLYLSKQYAASEGVSSPQAMLHAHAYTDGTPADGFGAAILMSAEGEVSSMRGAYIVGGSEDVTTASRDGYFGIYVSQYGSAYVHRFNIASNGSITASDTSIGSLSDERLKQNFGSYSYDIEDFKAFAPKTFEWINTGIESPHEEGQQFGFIAQEVEAIDETWCDTFLIPSGDPDRELIPDGDRGKTTVLGKKDAMYISVIQQLISRIETLETKVSTLEGN